MKPIIAEQGAECRYKMNQVEPPPLPGAPPARETAAAWEAALQLRFERRGGRTVLSSRRARGPLVVQKPLYPEGGVCHICLIHPPGGVVGGDRLRLEMALQARAEVLLTTPGAAKYYRSPGPSARLCNDLRVGEGAALEYLPQDCIFFSGSRVSAETTVHLENRAKFIGWETLCLGRPAAGDWYTAGCFNHRYRILRGDQPVLFERNRYRAGDDGLRAAWGLGGHSVVATLYALPAGDEELAGLRGHLRAPRDCAGIRFAATRIRDVLVLRCTGADAEACRELLVRAWRLLRPAVLKRPACAPRIWST